MNEILNKIEQQKAHFHEYMRPGCSEDALQRMLANAKKILGATIPSAYLTFLRQTNGLDWNGTVFFASEPSPYYDDENRMLEGIIEANQRLREVPANQEFLVFGESGIEMYVLDLRKDSFNIVDHISTDVYESYSSFESLLTAALEKRLVPGI